MNQVQGLTNYWVLQSSFSIGVSDAVADVNTMRQIESTINKSKLASSWIWSVRASEENWRLSLVEDRH